MAKRQIEYNEFMAQQQKKAQEVNLGNIMKRINVILSKIQELSEIPEIAVGKLDELRRNFSKCLDIVLWYLNPDVIEQLVIEEERKKSRERIMNE